MTTRKTKQLGAKAPSCIFNYKRAMKKNQILILLALEIVLATLFMATKNLAIVISQICITMIMIIYYVKKG